ncbi:sigma-54 dependent transcriptional regulator [Herbaspirillum sp. SJZ107]|uniref:sigma-54 dependent transcriptional regulator n=1 Tax=Herbaspirillum sp. SJZ107 TaxID=2572881 RepID=UPI00114E57E7|nr:sigma-54 dependent transcriptional regulator [Herbaspirillum sp. SJZ107]TQK01270.1 DNA-binding NtrC family response regulator [Herbaspirillum sp. SJZ107]
MHKRLLCISSCHDGPDPTAGLPALGWEICRVVRLADAQRELRRQCFRVGLVVHDGHLPRLAELAGFLGRHRAVHWVGVLRAGQLDSPAWRDLVADYLSDYHTVPADPMRLATTLGHIHGLAALQTRCAPGAPRGAPGRSPLLGEGVAMARLRAQVDRVAAVAAPVLVWGESGTGKELVAQAIHAQSARADSPFVPVNCAALSPSLIHAELFGHVRGAYTGAMCDRPGLIESADGGTLFLDEIGDLPLDQQASLLRFLQEKTICRIGATRPTRVDVRVVAASHVPLAQAAADGRVRADLYHRLAVLPIAVPALRERRDDVVLLAEHFRRAYQHEGRPRIRGFSRTALVALTQHAWPGNVRELINRVRRALVMADGELIEAADLGLGIEQAAAPAGANKAPRLTQSALRDCLDRNGNNVSRAARDLGLSRTTVYRLLGRQEGKC